MGHWGNAKAVNKAEKERRVRCVVEWIIQGYSTGDIIRQSMSLWNISERQSYNYNKWAHEELKGNDQNDVEEKRAKHVEMRLKLFRDLRGKETPSSARTALRIVDSIARIEGVYPLRDARNGWGAEYAGKPEDAGTEKTAVMVLPNGKEIEI
ncbi:hypothetical protein [Limibacterium fermenti]|uniref:hypothetical protein n=1 Tax=Limibacterium fermenti TaxID=3229863 RepID=UPI003A619F65